jgi:lipopolysaccharide export LptBFGC system permease protein LptF
MTLGKVAIFIACLALAAETAPVPESEELTLYEQQQELYNSVIAPETGLYEQQQELYNSLLQAPAKKMAKTTKKNVHVAKKNTKKKKKKTVAKKKPAHKEETTEPKEKLSGPYTTATEGTVKAEGESHKKAIADMNDENEAKLLKDMKVDAARDEAIKKENQKQNKQIKKKHKKYVKDQVKTKSWQSSWPKNPLHQPRKLFIT